MDQNIRNERTENHTKIQSNQSHSIIPYAPSAIRCSLADVEVAEQASGSYVHTLARTNLVEAIDARLLLGPKQSDPLGRIIARSKATANSVDIAVKTNADIDA